MFKSINRSMLPLFSGGLDLRIPFDNIPNLYNSLVSQYASGAWNGLYYNYFNNFYDGLNTGSQISGNGWAVVISNINNYNVARLLVDIPSGDSPVIYPSGIASLGSLIRTYTYAIVYENTEVTNTEDNVLLLTQDGARPGPYKFIKIYRPFGSDYLKIQLWDTLETNTIIINTIESTQGVNVLIMNFDDITKKVNIYINGVGIYTATNVLFANQFFDRSDANFEGANYWMAGLTPSFGNFWVGKMADQYLYNRVLTNSEINILGNFLAQKFNGNWINI